MKTGLPEWRIYYDNERTRDSLDGLPYAEPEWARGVLAVVFPDEPADVGGAGRVGRVILNSHDWYWHRSGKWYGGDLYGLQDQLMMYAKDVDCVCSGMYVANDEWQATMKICHDDPDFPAKSAKRRVEEPR